MDEMVEIRKVALEIVAYMSRSRQDVIQIVKDVQMLDLTLEYVKNYPNESIDNEVLISSLNLVSFVA